MRSSLIRKKGKDKKTGSSVTTKEKVDKIVQLISTIIAAAALIVSIVVMIKQDKQASDNIEIQKTQFQFAQRQFDLSQREIKKTDSIAAIRYKEQFNRDLLKFSKDTDFYNIQTASLKTTNFLQKYNQQVQLSTDEPFLIFDSLKSARTALIATFTNSGHRPIKIEKIITAIEVTNYPVYTMPKKIYFDTANTAITLVGYNQSFASELIYYLGNGWMIWPDDPGYFFWIKVVYRDVILNQAGVYKTVIWTPDLPPLKDSIHYNFWMDNPKMFQKFDSDYYKLYGRKIDF